MHCRISVVALVEEGPAEGAALSFLCCTPAAITPAETIFKNWPFFEDSTRENQSLGSGIRSTKLLSSRSEGLELFCWCSRLGVLVRLLVWRSCVMIILDIFLGFAMDCDDDFTLSSMVCVARL